MQRPPDVSVIIPVYNQVLLLEDCLRSLYAQEGVVLEIVVVDDQSPEDPAPVMERYPEAVFVRAPRNVGYAEANNLGLCRANGPYLLFLNSDTVLPPSALAGLVDYLKSHADVAGVAPRQHGADGRVQRSCFAFPTLLNGLLWDSALHRLCPRMKPLRDYELADWDYDSERWVEHPITSCLLVRRSVYDTIGGMDPDLVLFYNDADYCFRMWRAGLRIRFLPTVQITHYGSASIATFGKTESRVYADRCRYFRKWFGWRGVLALRAALWSRVGYEALVELLHLQFRRAARKVSTGLKQSRFLGGRA